VAWLLPELDDGAEPELRPELELELDEPELAEPELAEPDPVEAVPELPDPEEAELDDEPELAEVPDEVEDAAVLAVALGRVSATTPAAATLARVTVVVAVRTRARPRVRDATARSIRSRFSSLMPSSLRRPARRLLRDSSKLAMRQAPRDRRVSAR
jgi:hypothetical protein